MFKFKSTIVTPTTIICVGLMLVIITMLAFKPVYHLELDSDGVVREYTAPSNMADTVIYDGYSHTLTWRDMKSYQVEITNDGEYAIFYDYGRVSFVVPLDDKCNLTLAILRDND